MGAPMIKPFKLFFDKGTYAALGELSQRSGLPKPSTVILCVRLVYELSKDKQLNLTPDGAGTWREVYQSVKATYERWKSRQGT
jgi:hypothetical protein